MKTIQKMFIYVQKHFKIIIAAAVLFIAFAFFCFAKQQYTNADFGKTFGNKATAAENKMIRMQQSFTLCAKLVNTSPLFLQSIVFPEVMRYNILKDGIETESLRTLYTELGEDYADFSIGIFQMKPSFAEAVESFSASLLSDSIQSELQLNYSSKNKKAIRAERVERLQDNDYQLIYLTAFVLICNKIYTQKVFKTEAEKLAWYCTVYNAGFNKTDKYIEEKIKQDNFYLSRNMPGKKFRYAAVAGWYYTKHLQ